MRALPLLLLAACQSGAAVLLDGGSPSEPGPTGDTDTDLPTDPSDPPTSDSDLDFSLTVDADMVLMIHATWDATGTTEGWVEYRFDGDEWLTAPAIAPGEAVILGIPPETVVEARAALGIDGKTAYTDPLLATTGALPLRVLTPAITDSDPTLSSPAPYILLSVASGNSPFEGPYFVQILDRAGRIVWYHEVPDELFSFYPSVSFDGTHIWFEGEDIFGFANGDPLVTRMTLDGRWSVTFPVPGLGQAIAEGPDHSFFFERRMFNAHGVDRLDAAGATSTVWNCGAYFNALGLEPWDCVLNSCLWDAARNTVLASQFETDTVFEIDVATGDPIRQMGQLTEGDPYTFDPPDSRFAYQHYPSWTADGTILVSTHVPCPDFDPGCNEFYGGQYHVQRASEYTVDDARKTLTQVWYYESTDLWATQAGEAYFLPGGNLVQGYGQDGAVREVTRGGEVAWTAEFPLDGGMRLVGHASFIDDLYALNVGQ